MKYLIGLFTVLFSIRAISTTLPQVSIDEIYNHSVFVGIVLIEKGELIRNGENICAAKYTATVIESFKGNFKANEKITFGPYASQKIGREYLLFLTDKSEQFDPVATTNSASMKREQEFEKICGSVLPELLIPFHGVGILEISRPYQFKFEDSIKIPDKYISIPSELDKRAVEFADDHISGDEYWVKEKEFIEYMRNTYK